MQRALKFSNEYITLYIFLCTYSYILVFNEQCWVTVINQFRYTGVMCFFYELFCFIHIHRKYLQLSRSTTHTKQKNQHIYLPNIMPFYYFAVTWTQSHELMESNILQLYSGAHTTYRCKNPFDCSTTSARIDSNVEENLSNIIAVFWLWSRWDLRNLC